MALVQEGGGDEEGLTTGAKADFCLTAADTMLAGEKEKTPEEEEQLEGREVEEAMVGLDGTTGMEGVRFLERGEEKEQEDKILCQRYLDLHRLETDFLRIHCTAKTRIWTMP